MQTRTIALFLALALTLSCSGVAVAGRTGLPRVAAVLRAGEEPVVVLATGSGWTVASRRPEAGRWFVTYADERLVVLGDTVSGLPFELPAASERLPLDVLTAAVCRCAGVDLVLVGAPPAERLSWTASGGDAVEEMAVLWEALGRVVSRRPGLLVVGERPAPEAIPDGAARAMDLLDASSLAVVEALEGWARTSLVHAERGLPVTVSSRRLGLRALVLCLDAAGGLGIRRLTSLALRPAKPMGPLARAKVLARQGDLGGARQVLETEIRSGRGTSRQLVLLSRICWRQGQRRRALSVLERLVAGGGAPSAERVAQRMRAALAGDVRS